MCGIIGYIGARPCRELLLDGLSRMEYRGYDSAGIALTGPAGIERIRAVGKLSSLRAAVGERDRDRAGGVATLQAGPYAGIGHTRWATHGRVTEANAHPHADEDEEVHIVLNGIIENHVTLRELLEASGVRFTSETDAEVVAHLLAEHGAGEDLVAAVAAVRPLLAGHYAFVALSAAAPDVLVATRHQCPLVVGLGDGEHFVGSSDHAFAAYTRTVKVVGEDEIVVADADGVRFFTSTLEPVRHEATTIAAAQDIAGRDGHETYMLKEIHEQPAAVARTVAAYLPSDRATGASACTGLSADALAALTRLTIIGCGTSFHAGLIGRCAIEEWAQVRVDVELASEYRYRHVVTAPGDLVVGITQSGETADTLAAMRQARAAGATVLTVTNVDGSQAVRESDGALVTRAGIEVGVAATKTFTAQVIAMYLLALELAEARRSLPAARIAGLREELRELPVHMERLLAEVRPQVAAVAQRFHTAGFFLFLGRQAGLPVALEGALKLKEVTYIPTDAYAAGEMKHGPIAMLDEHTPVVCVATDSPVLDKTLSNVAEVRARGAHVIAVATEGSAHVAAQVDDVLWIPRTNAVLQASLASIPLQLLAYEIARLRGLDVDRPRNLAKTVTVE